MAIQQKFGIRYPFTSENLDEVYLDLNDTMTDSVKSQVLHVLFTPKGQRLRNPDFGTDLIKYIFGPKDETTLNELKASLTTDIGKYVENVMFDDITFSSDENDENSMIIIVHYSVKKGNKVEKTSIGIKI